MPQRPPPDQIRKPRLTQVVAGERAALGTGPTLRFRAAMFAGGMDPLVAVDHVVSTDPTPEARVHTGVSAVTAVFEGSRGTLQNRDSLGNHFALEAGGVYLLAAAQGAVHEAAPAPGASVDALHLLVDLPLRLRREPARAWRITAADVPAIEGPDHRVRVILGRSGATVGGIESPDGLTMLDGVLDPGARFAHELLEGRQAWVYAVNGDAHVHAAGESAALLEGHAVCVTTGTRLTLELAAASALHFVLVAGWPVGG